MDPEFVKLMAGFCFVVGFLTNPVITLAIAGILLIPFLIWCGYESWKAESARQDAIDRMEGIYESEKDRLKREAFGSWGMDSHRGDKNE